MIFKIDILDMKLRQVVLMRDKRQKKEIVNIQMVFMKMVMNNVNLVVKIVKPVQLDQTNVYF